MMAQSYAPTHQVNTTSRHTTTPQANDNDTETVYHDAKSSVFIFPNPTRSASPPSSLNLEASPTSITLSPSLSIPTDVSFTVSSLERSGSREGRYLRGRRGRSGSSEGWGRSVSRNTGVGSLDVEVWDWTGDESESGEEGEDVGEISVQGRTSRWDMIQVQRTTTDTGTTQPHRFRPRYPLRQVPTNLLTYADRRQRALHLRRTTNVSLSPSPARSEYFVHATEADGMSVEDVGVRCQRLRLRYGRNYDEQRRRRVSWKGKGDTHTGTCSDSDLKKSSIPLLSFFASLFSIDDDTLALLTKPALTESDTQTSILFCGDTTISIPLPTLAEVDNLISAQSESKPSNEYNHALAFLQLGDADKGLSKLREGVAVACDEDVTPHDRFSISLSLVGIWALVEGVWRAPTKILGDVVWPTRTSG